MLRLRPRPRFSLRTVFVLITLTSIYLGWQWRIVNERREIASWLSDNPSDPETTGMVSFRKTELSWVRRLLGDRHLPRCYFFPASDGNFARISSAFPEAEFHFYAGPDFHLRNVSPRFLEAERFEARPD